MPAKSIQLACLGFRQVQVGGFAHGARVTPLELGHLSMPRGAGSEEVAHSTRWPPKK